MKTIQPIRAIAKTLGLVFIATTGIAVANATDDRIEDSFNNSYVAKTYLKGDKVDVHSKKGAVILKGTVAKESHKDLAGETAANLPGVVKVENRIKIKGDAPKQNSDLWIHTKAETALLFRRNVSATSTEMTVKDGMVVVTGTADNQAEKDLTTEHIRDVQGVRGVKNDMVVVEPKAPLAQRSKQEVDDASITAQVKISLLSHKSTSSVNTHVKTKDGVVSLTGKAANSAEKDLVTKLSENIHGVKSVTNDMTL
jgi:hyperosmotically inducible periplasmic protein